MKHLTATALLLAGLTTVILLRHAEKDSAQMSGDPPLSTAGIARAQELARVLADANVSAIYTTPYKRTEDTVAPLAAALGIKPVVVKSAKTYASDVVAAIRAGNAGKTVLVVGHSNTTPDTIKALGIADPPAIPDSQYDDLFIVTFAKGVKPSLVKLRYGAQARPSATEIPAAGSVSSWPARTRRRGAGALARCTPCR